MRLAAPDRFARCPRVRQIGPQQDEVAIVVLAHVVADEPQASRVEGQRQFQLGMMVPLKRDRVLQPTVQHAPGGVGGLVDLLEKRLHWALVRLRTPEEYQKSPSDGHTAGR